MPNFRALARALTAVAAMTIFTSLPVAHAAEKYPNRPIRMILGFPAGGPTDVNARLFAQGMADQLGQPIIVENRPGAGSIIASNAVLAAAPDGYTILYNTSSLVLAAMLYTSAKYDPLKDFQPVIRTAGVPLVVAVNPSIGATTFGAFIDQARAKPKKLNYASSGAGTIDHLASALLATQLDIDLEHVPYKGTAPALVDLVSGATQMFFTTQNTLLPFIHDKRLLPLAIASLQRSPLMPDVPTISEVAELPGFEITAWNGIMVPAGTSPVIVERLNAAANALLKQEDFVAKLRATGAEPYGGTPQAYRAYLEAEIAKWRAVIEQAGVQPQ